MPSSSSRSCKKIEEARAELLARGRAKADGISHAFADRHAVVRPARRQIKQVARSEHPFALRLEAPQDLQAARPAQGRDRAAGSRASGACLAPA